MTIMDLSTISDEQLVKRFSAGDQAAFESLVQRFQDRVYRLALVWLNDARQAEDAAQEVFLRSLQGLPKFRFKARVFTWIYRTTRLVCHEINRQDTAQEYRESDHPIDPSLRPEQTIAQQQTIFQVRNLVAKLPARQREVVVLRVFEQLSVADTAAIMRCRSGTVKALLHKAHGNLKGFATATEMELSL